MTEKQAILYAARENDNIRDFLSAFIELYNDGLDSIEVHEMAKIIDKALEAKISEDLHAKTVAYERATYLKNYLEGKLYTDDKPEYKKVQVKNAKEIIDVCKTPIIEEEDRFKNPVKHVTVELKADVEIDTEDIDPQFVDIEEYALESAERILKNEPEFFNFEFRVVDDDE